MKCLLAILCSLLLLGGQFAGASASCVSTAIPVAQGCHCGGSMSCCAPKPVQYPQPLPANSARTGVDNQILSPVPLVAVLFWSAAGPTVVSSSFSPAVNAVAAPVFARNCVRLI